MDEKLEKEAKNEIRMRKRPFCPHVRPPLYQIWYSVALTDFYRVFAALTDCFLENLLKNQILLYFFIYSI